MTVSLEAVRGAQIRWWERSVCRYFDGAQNPDFDVSAGSPFMLSTQVGHGRRGDGGSAGTVRVKAVYSREDVQVTIDLDVSFLFDGDTEMDPVFVREHALPYAFGYVRGAFTDACRSAGLPGLMIPIFDASSAVAEPGEG